MPAAHLLPILLVASLLTIPAAAQKLTQPALTKVDQIALSIDLLANVGAAVTNVQERKRFPLFKLARVRTH